MKAKHHLRLTMMMIIRWWQAAGEIFSFCPHQRQNHVREWPNCFGSRRFNGFLNFLLSFLLSSQTVAWQPLQQPVQMKLMKKFLYCILPIFFSLFYIFADNQSEHTCTITMLTDFSKCGRKFLNFYSAYEIREQRQIFCYFFFLMVCI